jgi:predicted aminopeptidase
VPDFERLFVQQGSRFDAFYAEVRRLAALPKAERRAQLSPSMQPTPSKDRAP